MESRWSLVTRRWLGRFSISLFVIAFFLGWEGYKRHIALAESGDDWRTYLDFIAAAMSLGLGFMGVRERHRSLDDESTRR